MSSRVPSAASYVAKKLRELDVALVDTIPRVQRHQSQEEDDEAIHDMRVAIRRLRTLLKMSRSLFGRWHTDCVRRAYAEVMRATGELRDEEVLEETLAGAASHEAFAPWLDHRKTREAKLRHAVSARIERGDLDRARLMLKALLVFPIDPERDVDLARFARRTVERARRRVEGQRDVGPDDVLGLHDLRIAYKELRYSIELLSDALPIDARAMLEPATVFQKRLGEVHDVDVAIETITQTKSLPHAAREEALATLAAVRQKRISKYLRELDPLSHRENGPGQTNGSPAKTTLPEETGDAPTVHLQKQAKGSA
jgi:CHAD domain-containing protein